MITLAGVVDIATAACLVGAADLHFLPYGCKIMIAMQIIAIHQRVLHPTFLCALL